LAELGVTALQGAAFEQLLKDTARLTAEGLKTEFCKVLEYIPSENRFLVRAGVGWDPGVVGVATVGADLDSPAGFALRTCKPAISNRLENEERFRTPEILQRHGVHRAMNVILQGDGKPFGVLEVDSRSEYEFEERDFAFMQGAANLLGMAIERDRNERRLKAALKRDEVLLTEINHRVKNSLAMVVSLLRLQSNDAGDPKLADQLTKASHRVAAIAKAHDELAHGADECMDIGKYIKAVCKDLDESVMQCDVETDVEEGIEIATDRAVSTALIVNKLVTNAAKYAYERRPGGRISIKVARAGENAFEISVCDEGRGLPPGFDLNKPKGLGMLIVTSFAQQLSATIVSRAHDPGTEILLSVPLRSAEQ